jgi:streptogramin lyase
MSSDLREPEVREFLERMASEMPTPMQVPPAAIRRARRKLARTVIAGSLAAGVAVFGVLSGTRAILRSGPQPSDETTWEPVTAIPIGHVATHVAVGEGGVWVAGGDGATRPVNGSARVTRVDPSTGEVVATFPGRSAYGCSIAVGEGAAWVSGPGTSIVRIDPASNEVEIVQRDTGGWTGVCAISPFDLTFVAGAVWWTDDFALHRIDLDTNASTTIGLRVEDSPQSVAALDGIVWVGTYESRGDDEVNGHLVGVDPNTEMVVAEIPGRYSRPLASGFGSLWARTNGVVVRIDPATAAAVTVLDHAGQLIAVGEDGVWVASATGHIVQIDPATNEIAWEVFLGDYFGISPRLTDIAVGYGAVWVTDGDTTLYRIDPEAVGGPS